MATERGEQAANRERLHPVTPGEPRREAIPIVHLLGGQPRDAQVIPLGRKSETSGQQRQITRSEPGERVETESAEQTRIGTPAPEPEEAIVIEDPGEPGTAVEVYHPERAVIARPEDVLPPQPTVQAPRPLRQAEKTVRRGVERVQTAAIRARYVPMDPLQADRTRQRFVELSGKYDSRIPFKDKMRYGSIGGAGGEFILKINDGTFNPIQPIFHHPTLGTAIGEIAAIAGITLLTKGIVYDPGSRLYANHLWRKYDGNAGKARRYEAKKDSLAAGVERKHLDLQRTDKLRKQQRLHRRIAKDSRKLGRLE